MRPEQRLKVARILAFVVVLALSILIFTFRDQAQRLAIYGYPGIFLLSFLSYATVVLPAPGIFVVFTMGGVFNPLLVALSASTGAALGELSGYLAGFSGQAVVEKAAIYDRLTSWMNRNGTFTVLLLAAIPNPFFDLAGIIAGSLRMRLARFLIWCWIGETLKMVFFAYSGANLVNLLPVG